MLLMRRQHTFLIKIGEAWIALTIGASRVVLDLIIHPDLRDDYFLPKESAGTVQEKV